MKHTENNRNRYDFKRIPNAEQIKEYRTFINREQIWEFLDKYDIYTRRFYDYDEGRLWIGAVDAAGEVLVPAIYDNIGYIMPDHQRHNVVPAELNGKMALVAQDGKGTPVTEFEYDDIYFLHGPYYVLVKDGKKGLADTDGTIYLETDLDQIYAPIGYNLVPYMKDGKYGFTRVDYGFRTDTEFDSYEVDEENRVLRVVQNGESGYVSHDGYFTTDPEEQIRLYI